MFSKSRDTGSTLFACKRCNLQYLLLELDICGDHVFGVLSWFPRRLPDVDSSLSNLVDTVS